MFEMKRNVRNLVNSISFDLNHLHVFSVRFLAWNYGPEKWLWEFQMKCTKCISSSVKNSFDQNYYFSVIILPAFHWPPLHYKIAFLFHNQLQFSHTFARIWLALNYFSVARKLFNFVARNDFILLKIVKITSKMHH